MTTLVTIPFSHYCEKARWALDYARVDYREEGHVPGFHRIATRRAGGRNTVPVLVLDDGSALDDSPLIVRWADERAGAERKLLPPEGPGRDEALALERRFDRDLGPHVRRFGYFHVLPDRALTLRLMDASTPRAERVGLRALFPVLRRFMRRHMRIDEAGAVASRDRYRAVFDEVAARLKDGRPYLMGDRFGAADITFAALAAPLLGPAEVPFPLPPVEALPAALGREIDELRAHPAGALALRVYRTHRTR